MNQASDFTVHFSTPASGMNQASDLPVHAAAEKQMELPFGSPIYRISNMTV